MILSSHTGIESGEPKPSTFKKLHTSPPDVTHVATYVIIAFYLTIFNRLKAIPKCKLKFKFYGQAP